MAGLLFLLVISSQGQTQQDPLFLLNRLRESDAQALTNTTLNASVRWMLLVDNQDTEQPSFSVRITNNGREWAYRSQIQPDTPPPRLDPSQPDYRSFPAGPVVSRRQSEYVYTSPDLSGVWSLQHNYSLTGEGETKVVILNKSIDPLQDWQLYIPVLGTGRGYSFCIDSIEEVTETDSNALLVRATGRFPNPQNLPCKWELLLEPGAAYLVRRATRLSLDGTATTTEFQCEGSLSANELTIAAKARFRFGGEQEPKLYRGDGFTDIVYTGISAGFDESLAKQARERITPPYEANTFLLDDRLENPVGVIVGSETEEAVSELRNLLTTETPAQKTADASTKPEIPQPMDSENTKTGSTTVPIKLIAPIAAFILAGAAYALARRRRART